MTELLSAIDNAQGVVAPLLVLVLLVWVIGVYYWPKTTDGKSVSMESLSAQIQLLGDNHLHEVNDSIARLERVWEQHHVEERQTQQEMIRLLTRIETKLNGKDRG